MAGPDFLGIGAQKAGTTWLHAQLQSHPDIWLPPCKEIHYFDRATSYPSPNDLSTPSPLKRLLGKKPWEGPRMKEGAGRFFERLRERNFQRAAWEWRWYFGNYDDRWYANLFPRSGYLLRGEVTPEYSILEPADVERIREMNPDVRLIFLLRNPAERSWSSVRFNAKLGYNRVDLNEIDSLLEELGTYRLTRRCDYMLTLRTYLKFFPADRILVGFYDAIQENPSAMMSGIFKFLGVDESRAATHSRDKVLNESPKREKPPEVRAFLNEMYLPKVREMAALFGGGYAARWVAELGGEPCDTTAPAPPVIRLSDCANHERLTA